MTFDRERWGQRTSDINTDGVANYGLHAVGIEAQRVQGGEDAMTNLFDVRGAEAYLEMWERAWRHSE